MRTSGVASDTPLTVAIFAVALAFLIVLAGGPSQFMHEVEQTLRATIGIVTNFVQRTGA